MQPICWRSNYVLKDKTTGKFIGLHDDFRPAYKFNRATEPERDFACLFFGYEIMYSDVWENNLIALESKEMED